MNEVEKLRARNALRQKVQALLRGSGLEIRELAHALAIFNPRDPDRGRIHVTYASGEASWKRVSWEYLGPLPGYEPDDDPDREPSVDAAKIIAALAGRTPSDQPRDHTRLGFTPLT